MHYPSPILQEIPHFISQEDRKRLLLRLDFAEKVLLYNEMIDRYSHPFFMVHLADLFLLFKADSLAVDLYRKAQALLSSEGIVDKELGDTVDRYGPEVDREVNDILAKSREGPYYQTWKPTKQHPFPTKLPQLPSGSQEVKDQWQMLTSEDAPFSSAYLLKLAIETNHVESTFLLTEGSTQDLIRRGLSEGDVNCLPDSSINDAAKIKSILNDTLSAYKLLTELCDDVGRLDKATVCRMHSSLMNTCQFSDMRYIPAGRTRTETRKTVVVAGTYKIECCPFPEVDAELEYICRMAKQWIKSWRNPFATASWIHLVFVRCHPFEDGNGRLVRMLASIPLIQHGYPPISVGLTQRVDYYGAINKAYEGDHSPLIQCMLQGIKETVLSVQSLCQ